MEIMLSPLPKPVILETLCLLPFDLQKEHSLIWILSAQINLVYALMVCIITT